MFRVFFFGFGLDSVSRRWECNIFFCLGGGSIILSDSIWIDILYINIFLGK